mgnify:FL=1
MIKNFFIIIISSFIFISCSNDNDELSGNVGLFYQTTFFDGLSRDYIMYIPNSYEENESLPIVFNLHGGSGTADEHINYVSDMRGLSDSEKFILVYPQASSDSNGIPIWNLGGVNSKATDVDDVGYISHLIDKISEFYSVDKDRVYVTGFSNGGYLSFELACKLSSRIAAFASVAGHMFIDTFDECSPTHPTPFLSINGTEDNYNGIAGYYLPIENSNNYWIDYNNTDLNPNITDLEDVNTSDGSTVKLYSWKNGTNGVEIEHYKVIGGDHSWPSLNSDSDKDMSNGDIDSDRIIWEFFSRFDINGLR